jgi:RNA polymerase sigma factor (sigma-70 family)
MDDRTDRELVESARAGDKEAFGLLAGRCQGLAWRIAGRMVSNEDTIREIVQEALLEAYLSLNRLRDAGRFKSWLVGIVLNLCRSYVRQQKRRGGPDERIESDSFALLRQNADTPDPQKVAEERELHRLVLSAIEELQPAHREAALLFYYEYLSVQEIAVICGISVGAVKVRLHRARSQLRTQLSQQLPELNVERITQARRKKMIEVRIADVVKQDERTIVFLLDETGKRVLPIWIGFFEGASIVTGLRGFSTPRPMTFNFVANLLETLGARLEEARIETLKDEVFYGVAKLRSGEAVSEVDARPSDVLALAVRTGSPIYVSEEVMEKAGKAVLEGAEMPVTLRDETELPFPTGEGMEAILKEVEEALRRPPGPARAGETSG